MSVMLAIQFMQRVLAGKIDEVPQPVWCNFVFFHRIEPGRIEKIRRIEPTSEQRGYWVVEREITFYLLKTPVAVVTMQGHRSDGEGKGDASTSWKQSRIRYARAYGTGVRPFEAAEWRDVELPVIGYTSFLMPSQVPA